MSAATNALRNIEDIYPLTPMQEGLLFHTLLYPGSGMYLMQDRYLLEGTLDHAAFRRAWQQVVDRHCVLRTSFVWENQKRPLQIVHKHVTAPVIELDWRGKNPADQTQELDALLKQELQTGFDFTKAPLLCLRLIRMADRTYRFVRSYHHVLMDAWCFSLFMVDFFAFYDAQVRGKQKTIPRPRPYRDYIAWLQQQDPRAAENFWRDYLRGFTVPTPLGIGETVQQAGKNEDAIVADQMIHLSADTTSKLSTLAQQHQLTLNTFVQGAWALLLNRYSGEHEVVFGVTVAGRPPELDGVESMLGLFINSLPLRVSIDPGAPILAWLKALLAQNVGMRQYEYAPLVQIQGWSEVPRGRALFDSLLVFESAPVDPSLMSQAMPFDIQEEGNRTHTNYPLTAVIILGTELGLQLSYNPHAFESATIARLLEHFQAVLEQMAAQPDCRVSDITMLRAPEQHQVIQQWNRTRAEYPAGAGIAELFAAQAARTPAAVAVQCGPDALTYAELDRQAAHVAAGLEAAGVGPDEVVGVLAERSLSLVVLILGVFKAGAGYLPLDPQHPAARWRQILTHGGVGVLVTHSSLEDQVRAAFPAGSAAFPVDLHTLEALLTVEPTGAVAAPATHPGQVGYVIFTSGSTGTPKGAVVTQQGMVNNVWGKGPTLGLTESDVVAQTASACFDISVWQLLSALLWGGRVEIFEDEIVRDPPRLLAEFARTGVTVAELVPSLLREVVAVEPAVALPRLRWLLPTGEAVTPELCRSWFARYPAVPLLNAYGPAECADDVAYHALPGPPAVEERGVPIGRPAANLQLYILTAELAPVPVGVSGELCVGGVGVGRGYLQEPARTADRFVPHPFSAVPGARLYRTGDIGRYRADGTIEFLGRRDHQVKVRGFRIELGEIEAALAAEPGVEDQVVLVREDRPGQRQVVAYVVGEAGREPERLRRALRERLPEYMVPALVVALAAVPLTPNGKVNRAALPAPEGGSEAAAYVAPQTPTEALLAGIWAEVLGCPRVGRSDNFFDLGGHSLLATQIMSRLRKIFDAALPLRSLFECPTIVELAGAIELYHQTPATGSRLIPLRATGIRPPLYCFDPSGSHVLTYRPLAAALSLEQPVFGIDSSDLWNLNRNDISMTAFAEECADMLNEFQAEGPYHLIGWSKGGVLALATAQALERRGRTVGFLGILDTQVQMLAEGDETIKSLSPYLLCLPEEHQREILALDVRELQTLQQELAALSKDQRLAYAIRWTANRGYLPKGLPLDVVIRGCLITRDTRGLMEAARFSPVLAPITAWWCDETLQRHGDAPIDWAAYTTGGVEIHTANSDHMHLLGDAGVHDTLDRILDGLYSGRSVPEYSDSVNEAR